MAPPPPKKTANEEELLPTGDVVITSEDVNFTLLEDACCQFDTKLIEELVNTGAGAADVLGRYHGKYWVTPLHMVLGATTFSYAPKSLISGVVKLLMDHGADANVPCGRTGDTALHVAVATDPEMRNAELLLRHGADINSRNADEETPLHHTGEAHMIELLLNLGADITARDRWGTTKLLAVAKHGRCAETMKLLINRGAELHVHPASEKKGRSPLLSENTDVIALFLHSMAGFVL